jgi:hypothetical protein
MQFGSTKGLFAACHCSGILFPSSNMTHIMFGIVKIFVVHGMTAAEGGG